VWDFRAARAPSWPLRKTMRDELIERVRAALPKNPDGEIEYAVCANAVKARAE